MLFSSTVFIYLFLPTVVLLYYIIPQKKRFLRNILLLCASLFFYAWGEPRFVLAMMASIVTNWLFGILIYNVRENRKKAGVLLGIDVAFNLGLLFVFKYFSYACTLIRDWSGSSFPVPKIALPIGISFFTFQAMSYVIDVYRQKVEVQKNLLYVGLYISFFPQLIAGPIVRYETIAAEIENRKENADDFFDGFARFVMGLSKKVLLANSFAILADQAFDAVQGGASVSVMFGWLGAIAYSLQIFFDFSGYSDMAIGMGRMFGFHFSENFNYPYISTSITEFWRRWHISLGTWFRDYLYIPLGGNRRGNGRTVLNLFIVWLLTGMWHGANLTFLVWGLLYFVLLTVEKAMGLTKTTGKVVAVLRWLYTGFFVTVGWIVFRSETISDAYVYIKSVFGLNGNPFSDGLFAGWVSQNISLLIVGAVLCTPVVKLIPQKWKDNTVVQVAGVIGLCCLFVLSIASILSNSYNPFIYFNF